MSTYAVQTKKRKFHRVLESLSKPLALDASTKFKAEQRTACTAATRTTLGDDHHIPSTTVPTTDFPIKMARLSSGEESGHLTAARSTVLKVGKPPSRATAVVEGRPSFVPWDRERFLERLETFRRVDRWSPKPKAINEVVWAKRGWVCTDVMRVTCVGSCGGSVVVKLPDDIDELDGFDLEKVKERNEVRAKLVEEYARLVVEGHGERCLWRTSGCDATIHRLPLTNPDTAISHLQTRYRNLVRMGDKLPAVEAIEGPENFDMDSLLAILPDGVVAEWTVDSDSRNNEADFNGLAGDNEAGNESSDAIPPVNRSAFALAFLGWNTVSDGAAGLAGCGACFRRLGLWMYKPKENGEATVYNTLNVVSEHMEYCPWINGEAQSGTGKVSEKSEDLRAGWELLSHAIRVKHRRRTRPMGSTDTVRTDAETRSIGEPILDDEAQKAKDREWWAKLLRMRQVLNVRAPKRAKPPAS